MATVDVNVSIFEMQNGKLEGGMQYVRNLDGRIESPNGDT